MRTPSVIPRTFVFTDRPQEYRKSLESLGIHAEFRSDVNELIDAILDADQCPGLILDIRQVMAMPPRDRDRLFSLSSRVPILRTKMDAASGHVIFIDEFSLFQCSPAGLAPFFRASVRVSVDLACLLSGEDDPAMARPLPARIGDISEGGCLLRLPPAHPVPDFLHLRIPDLANPLPIFCNVRWRAPAGPDRDTPGAGVKFLDIKPDQMDEITARFLQPAGE